MKKFIICIFLIFFYHNCYDQYSSELLQTTLDEYLKDKTNVLGTIVKVNISGTESYEAASGFIDSSKTKPINSDTKFNIASITKVFTSVLVHQYIEKGQVNLKDPIFNYLPADWSALLCNIEYGREITVEHTLSHRSGIADITEFEELREFLISDSSKRLKPLDALEWVQQKGVPKFKPGDNFDYCNINYILLGALIENVSGNSYLLTLQENILDRIGLESTFLAGETIGSSNMEIAHSYLQNDDKLYDGHNISLEWGMAAGGIISNADNLIKFYEALVSGKLFDRKETYEQMSQLVDHNESYGKGLEVNADPDIGLHYGHQGSLFNTRTILAYFPQNQITISICHTFDGFSMLRPRSLMESILHSINGFETTKVAEFEGYDILNDTTNVIVNEDIPTLGEWDFEMKEVWTVDRINDYALNRLGKIHVDSDGSLFLFEKESSKILVLDNEGNLLTSFGGYGDGHQFQYVNNIYMTSDYVHVLDMGNSGDKIKKFDKKGNYKSAFKLDDGVSPSMFINYDQYIAVRSGSNIEVKSSYEQLLLLSSNSKEKLILGKIAADDKLVISLNVNRGRMHHIFDDIEIFPRLIVHLDNNILYLARSDRYLIKKIELDGNEILAFGIQNRIRTALPSNYTEIRLSEIIFDGDKELPADMKEKFMTGFPNQHVFLTKIILDEEGLIYVFLPDIVNLDKQEIDIFSPEGKYLYNAIIEIPYGLQKIKPLVIKDCYLYALVINESMEHQLVKYEIKLPNYSIKEEI